jgi:hypothetical protein
LPVLFLKLIFVLLPFANSTLDTLILLYDTGECLVKATIDAWAKSRKLDKAVRAAKVLNKMIQIYESGLDCAKPNAVCYTAVLNACAYCENDPYQKQLAMKIAITTYKSLQKSAHVQANSATYVNMITALRNLLAQSNERDAAIRSVFRDACQAGLVDSMVVQRVKCKPFVKVFLLP